MSLKKNILKNAKTGTRIFNDETGIYYVRTKEGTWQKDDLFLNQIGRVIRGGKDRDSDQSPLDREFDNTIGENNSFDITKTGFTINNSSPLADELREFEKQRVLKRDLSIIARIEADNLKLQAKLDAVPEDSSGYGSRRAILEGKIGGGKKRIEQLKAKPGYLGKTETDQTTPPPPTFDHQGAFDSAKFFNRNGLQIADRNIRNDLKPNELALSIGRRA